MLRGTPPPTPLFFLFYFYLFSFTFQKKSENFIILQFQGDSGSALVCRHNDGFADRWVQAGIASFTSASRPGEIPGVFTRVSAYADWIQQTMNDN